MDKFIVGRIIGKTTTRSFQFLVEAQVKKFDFVQVYHKSYDKYILCQINEIEKDIDKTLAICSIIGYRDKELKQIRVPFDINSEVLVAEDELIKEIFRSNENGAYIGKLEGKNIKIFLDINKLLTKHVAILAKSGAGKSYTTGVLIEEILERNIPLLIIDPHGEYSTLKLPADSNEEANKRMKLYGIEPKGYKIREYGNIEFIKDGFPLKVKDDFTINDIEHILPGKLSNSQISLLFSVAHNLDKLTINDLIYNLEAEESNMKWQLINLLSHIKKMGYFSENVDYKDFFNEGGSIINLRGIPPEIQEIIVYKLLKDLFELRKRNIVPPFFTVIEEAHNFCPERSYGEKKSSKIIRNIASEGRKFGMGLCIISQRPARVEKSVLSQCTTQIIMNVTNPNDLKSILSSVEGITQESYDEIKNLPVGTALISGVVDMPLVVSIRPRKTMHGGEGVSIFENNFSSGSQELSHNQKPLGEKNSSAGVMSENTIENLEDIENNGIQDEYNAGIENKEWNNGKNKEWKDNENKEWNNSEKEIALNVILPDISYDDFRIMEGDVKVQLIPVSLLKMNNGSLLVDKTNGEIIIDINQYKTKKIFDFKKLTRNELLLLKKSYNNELLGYEDIKSLVDYGLLDNEGNLSEDYLFSKLDNFLINKGFELKSIRGEIIKEGSEEITHETIKIISSLKEIDEIENGWLVRYAPSGI